MRAASGWYLAAWRDFRGLTLEDVAEEVNTSKGMVSDLETGALNSKGERAQRYNRDWVDRLSTALGISGGHLIDVNPFTIDENESAWTEIYRSLPPSKRRWVLDMLRNIPPDEQEAVG